MRKVTAGLFMSLDGVVESPHEWRQPFDAETNELISSGLEDADALLLGTKTYQEFADFWPNAGKDVPQAAYFNAASKYVASTTLKSVDWVNSVLLTGDLAAEIARLKNLPGKNIQIPGSPRLVRWLLENGLLDELSLFIQPIALGAGLRLFDGLGKQVRLTLTDSKRLGNGSVSVNYVPARD